MKALSLLTLGVATLAAMTLNLSAGEALQSPRAKANDAKVLTIATDHNTAANTRPVGVSPRAFANQATVVKGTADSVRTTAKCTVVGSPKHLASASKVAGACCCGTITAACAMNATCCAMN